ncbi:hypothetical protein EV175_002713 [Coemansia sp. RSA 1933]|nr:hypothetical protein EV175_002713 [Coemansia sp. RSA 1933]
MSPMAPAGGAGGYMHDYSVAGMPYPDNPGMAYDPAYSWQQQHNYHLQGVNNASGRPASQFAPQPGGAQNPWPPANNRTASKRRQPGAAFVKHGRAASAGEKSERSNGTTESWQSNTGRGARSSVHANTEPAYEGSVYVISPVSNSVDADPNGTKRRAHSYGQAEHRRRLMAKRVSDVLARPRPANNGNNNVPPVPPLPQNIQQFQHYQHPPQQQQYYAPYPVAGGGVGGGGGGWSAQNQMYMGNQQRMYADVQSLTRKRNEMSTDTPSLLQQLDHARVLGVLPSRHQEKAAYTRGAYQNYNTSHLMTNGTRTNMQYLGDGNTLLIDQAYEAERSRNAILKKISHTYKGIGGESAPAPVF